MSEEVGTSSLAYLAEQVGAFTIPGPHHRDGGSQDSFWPSTESGSALLGGFSARDYAQHGRLYLLADGVSLCADGKEASRIAVETTGEYYYETAAAYPNTDQGRMQRLEDAAWQAHLRVAAWDERLFCWRSEAHDDGVTHHFKRSQIKSMQPPLCPLCNQPVVGLQTTLLAALVRGQQLMIVGIGDCSAFRLPANADHGIEWIFPPQDGQFCGMPSLARESIVGQSFIMTPGDSVLLASDGLVKVLNGLHADANWHHMLRERLTDDYRGQVEDTLQDLHGWRLSKPRQRKLHDDLTLVAVQLAQEELIKSQNSAVNEAYDELVARQQQGGLTLDTYKAFLNSAEIALVSDADPKISQLYSEALHHFALTDFAISDDYTDERHATQLKAAALIGRRSTEWVTVYEQFKSLSDLDALAQVSAETHTQITSNLYSADWPSAPAPLLPRVRNIIELAAAAVADPTPYKSFLSYLDSVKVMDRSMLPDRDAVVSTSTEDENVRALEMRVTQSISEGKWNEAQELIIELNKMKGATLNFDTEGVDTSPTRPVRNEPRNAPVRSAKAVARIVESEGTSDLVVPFERVQRVFHSREPNALLRDASHAAFSTKAEYFDLGMAADLLSEAAKLYPVSAVMPAQWTAMWHDPNSEFELVTSAESPLTFERLAEAIGIARDLSIAVRVSGKASANALQKSEAKKQHAFVKQWETVATDKLLLPYRLGRGAWWQANQLLSARLLLPQERETDDNTLQRRYADGAWAALLSQGIGTTLGSDSQQIAIDALGETVTSKEEPWSLAAYDLQDALAQPTPLQRAAHVVALNPHSGADQDTLQRLRIIKDHFVTAAWENTLAQSEGRIRQQPEEMTSDLAVIDTLLAAQDKASPHAARLTAIGKLLKFNKADTAGEIVGGFQAYKLPVSKRLADPDHKRVAKMRFEKVSSSWEAVLDLASKNQPYYLPPEGNEIGRIKPNTDKADGRLLHAVRALLPHLSQSYDNWLDYAAFVCQWQPPHPLDAANQAKFVAMRDGVVSHAWDAALSAVRSEVIPNFSTGQAQTLAATYAELPKLEDGSRSASRFNAIQSLFPLIVQLKGRNGSYSDNAMTARRHFQKLGDTLAEEDLVALDAACDVPVETLWRFAVDAAAGRNGNVSGSTSIDNIQRELDTLDGVDAFPNDNSVWMATGDLLSVARERVTNGNVLTEQSSQALFKAFRNTTSDDESTDATRRNRELYELSYHQLVGWKDALPVHPGLFNRRRINAEKRRIQEYWLLRKEYGL